MVQLNKCNKRMVLRKKQKMRVLRKKKKRIWMMVVRITLKVSHLKRS